MPRQKFIQAFICFFPLLFFGQTYNFTNYGVKEGLSQSNVSGIIQDSAGFYWFSTEGGLSRFDGINFTNYSTENGLADNNINALFYSSDNKIWIGHLNGAITFYDGKNFKEVKSDLLPKDKKIYSFFEDHDGNIWIGTESKGCLKIKSPKKNNYSSFDFEAFDSKVGMSQHVISITEDNEGTFWFLTDIGIKILKPNTKEFVFFHPTGMPPGQITTLYSDKNKNILLGTFSGNIARYFPKEKKIESVVSVSEWIKNISNPASTYIFTTYEDLAGNVWASIANTGLLRISGKDNSVSVFSIINGLSSNKIKCIAQDNEGNLLFGTVGEGVDVFSGETFVSHNKKNGLNDNQVWAICEDDEKNIWFGTGDGITVYNPREKINAYKNITVKEGLNSASIRALINDKQGKIWIGTWGGKIQSYDLKSKRIENISVLNEIVHNLVSCLMIDKHKRLWIGTVEGIVIYDLNTKQIKTLRTIDGLCDNDVSCIYETENGNIWIGTKQKGACVYDGKNFKKYNRENGLNHNSVSSFVEDNQHRIWIGTEGGGVWVLENKTFKNYRIKDGLLSDFIALLNKDEDGNIWMGSNRGLNKFKLKNSEFKSYSNGEGFTGLEAKSRAAFKDSEKNLWFGTVNGAYEYYPKKDLPNTKEPTLQLLQFKVNLSDYPISKIIELSYKENSFAFYFVGISLSNPEGVKYKIKMENYDSDWRKLNQDNENYSNLPPGNYTFKLQACNSSGICNSTPFSMDIFIKPPFWQTWWFYVLVFVFVSGSLFAYIKWRERKLTLEKKILEDKIAERTAEVVEKNKELDEKNTDIMASIRYAKRIQEAILPPDEFVRKHLPNSFVLFRPKDIVSGDFYWMEDKGDTVLYAAVDCTGHGVPGAFMSIVGHNLLDRILGEQNITEPAKILDELNKSLSYTLRQADLEDNTVKDGMDITLCSFNKKTAVLQFAGAFNPLWFVRNGELTEIKVNKFPIGNTKSGVVNHFTNHEMQLEKGDTVYIFSDGYCDQFGGPQGKKFKASNLRQLLLANQHLNMDEQKHLLLKAIDDWRGQHEQVDDILVIGSRYV